VIGHDETGHNLALDDMALHDFRHVTFGFDLIPHAFGIDHDTRSLGTMIEAPGLIGAYDVFQVQPLCFLLEVRVKRFRSKLRAASTWIVGAPLVCTDENMSGECRQKWSLLGLHHRGLHATDQLRNVGCSQEGRVASHPGQNRRNLA